jgi:cobalt-zinc-cadmium efflux system protein
MENGYLYQMSDTHQHKRNQSLTLAFWLNVIFSIIELVGAFYTNSTAILTDAIHDLGDSIAIGLGIVFEKRAARKPDDHYTYGYKRYSLVSALVLSTILFASGIVMVYKAIERFIEPQEVNAEGMFGLAILGVVVNGAAFLRIQHTTHNHNSKAIMFHFLEDVLGWIAVLVGSAVMYVTNWVWVDGVLSIGIALFIGYNASRNGWNSLRILLLAAPETVNLPALRESLMEVKGIVQVAELYVWSLDEETLVASVKVVMNQPSLTEINTCRQLVHVILEQHHIHHHTVEVYSKQAEIG